ncbi:YadA-like family protein [Moraxella lacunata]
MGGGHLNKATGEDSTIGGGHLNKATGEDSTIGGGHLNKATGEDSTIGGGHLNKATGEDSTIGGGISNQATGGGSTIGGGISNQATGGGSTIGGGQFNKATGRGSTIAGGYLNQAAGKGSFAAGVENQANTENAIAVGKKNIIYGNNSVAIGSNNTVAKGQKDVFILGSNTSGVQSNSVLLGNNTSGKEATTVNNATVGNLNLTGFAGTSKAENGVVSVGSEGGERQIVNVGAGEISATSTDAVNGSQLHALATAINEKLSGNINTKTNNTNTKTAESLEKGISQNQDDIAKNQADIAKNIDNIQNLKAETLGNRADVQELKRKQENDIKDVVGMQNAIAEQADKNTADIATNKADADAKFKGVQTDIANNKTTLAQHANQINENKQAIEAKLGGKADVQKLAELKTNVDKNQADADAKFKGVQTDIANNKTTLAQHTKKIDDNQQAIEAKLGGKADVQKLAELKTNVDKNQADADAKFTATEVAIAKNTQSITTLDSKVNTFDGRISALDAKVNGFDGRINALDDKFENGIAAQAALNGLFQPYSVGKVSVSAAIGGYGSKSAIAIGAGYRVNPQLAFKGGTAINVSGSKKGSYNIGVNYEF